MVITAPQETRRTTVASHVRGEDCPFSDGTSPLPRQRVGGEECGVGIFLISSDCLNEPCL